MFPIVINFKKHFSKVCKHEKYEQVNEYLPISIEPSVSLVGILGVEGILMRSSLYKLGHGML